MDLSTPYLLPEYFSKHTRKIPHRCFNYVFTDLKIQETQVLQMGAEHDEGPSKSILKILDMEPTSTRKHEMESW